MESIFERDFLKIYTAIKKPTRGKWKMGLFSNRVRFNFENRLSRTTIHFTLKTSGKSCVWKWRVWSKQAIVLARARAEINGNFIFPFVLTFEQTQFPQNKAILLTFTVKYAHMREFAKQKSWGKKTIACHFHCLVCHRHHINEHRHALLANGWSAFKASNHDCAWCDRSTNLSEVGVNVPRTIDILHNCNFLCLTYKQISTLHHFIHQLCFYCWKKLKNVHFHSKIACLQTLYFLFKVRLARVIKYKPQGIYWPPAQGGSGGGRRK